MLSENDLDTASRGIYVLLIRVPEVQTITVGSLDTILFAPGDYAYVGSALNGLKARLDRHLRREKKIHWHIDYLLQRAAVTGIIVWRTQDKIECLIAQALSGQFDAIPGFGSSDCRCSGHLFFAAQEMKQQIMRLLTPIGLRPELLEDLSQKAVYPGR